jgi:hypothetical protein
MTTGDELARIRAPHAGPGFGTPVGQLAAANALLTSDVVSDVELAHTLALAAMRAEPLARRVAATAYDRLRMLAGAPQKFGTQGVVRDGQRVQWPVDPATTDSERAKWGLPSLAELVELQRRAAASP